MKKNRKQKKIDEGKKAERYSRIDSAIAALQSGPIPKAAWPKKANELYVKHDGTSNISESAWATRHTLSVLRALGSIEEKEDGTLSLKK
jgi:hypothetical protein